MTDCYLSIEKQGDAVQLQVSGGTAPFWYQKADLLCQDTQWSKLGRPTLSRTRTCPISGEQGYFRVEQSIQLAVMTEDGMLIWALPDLT